jgi:hypothetical protein
MTEAEDTVDEIEILSVELFILEFKIPNRLPALVGKEFPFPGAVPNEHCLPIPACRFEADDAAKRDGNTGEAPFGGVRGSFVECEVSDELELLVRLDLPTCFPFESRLEEDELWFSSFSERAFRSFVRKIDLLLLEGVWGELPELPIPEEALERVALCPCWRGGGALSCNGRFEAVPSDSLPSSSSLPSRPFAKGEA